MSNPLISVIVPAYNTGKFLREAVQSVMTQTYQNWELIIVNDGSTDSSKEVALSYGDARIRYFEQENKGVSAARNLGLANMTGDYFCFLDADDIMPSRSLEARIDFFKKHPQVSFVDGRVKTFDVTLQNLKAEWQPALNGNPLEDLVRLTGKSFFGPTWMIKRKPGKRYSMREGLRHGEDLLFYMELARKGGIYGHADEEILHYRDTPGSAMKDLKGLEHGYRHLEKEISQWPEVSEQALKTYQWRYKKAMFLAYLRQGKIRNTLKIGWI